MTINQTELNLAISAGIIDLDSVQEELMKTKREKVRKLHRAKLTPPKSEGGRWQTWYVDSKGKHVNVKARSEEELLDKLIPIYLSNSHIEKMTFYELYEEWLEYKTSMVNSINTIQRHKQHYKKYLKDSKLHNMTFVKIDSITLEKECNNLVRENKFSAKEWGNIKTIIKGMYEYAMRNHYINENPFLEVKIMVKFRQVIRKTGRTETYNTDELQTLHSYLDEMYAETGDSVFMAVKINFYLGLRVGELVALKWKDLLEDKKIHIVREEIRNHVTYEREVVEHTKTNTDRFVVLVPTARYLFSKLANVKEDELYDYCIDHEDDFIFLREGKRIDTRKINYVLEKFAERTGIRVKSSHKIRKTYASNLNAAGVPIDCIREQLGHTNLSTTLQYIFNPLTEEQTYNLLTKAL